MTVLPHEGKFNILYRSYEVPVGTGFQPGYLARPDEVGEFPGVLVLPDIYGLTSFEKAVCRRLARQGYVAVAIDSYRDVRPGAVGDLDAALTAYASVPDRRVLTDIDEALEFMFSDEMEEVQKGPMGIVGFDTGGRFGLLYAALHPSLGAVITAYSPLAGDDDRDWRVADELGRLAVPVLGLFGRDDPLVPAEGVDTAATMHPGGTWILYDGTGHDFLNEDADGYHDGAAVDAHARIVKFLASHLPAPVVAAY